MIGHLRARLVFVLPLVVAVVSGCATALHGTQQTVSIRTTPPGATATIYPLDHRMTTPGEVLLQRRNVYTVRLEKEGYRCVLAYLDRTTATATHLSLGLVAARDFETGAAFALVPATVDIELHPEAGTSVDGGRCEVGLPEETVYRDPDALDYTRAPPSERNGLRRQ